MDRSRRYFIGGVLAGTATGLEHFGFSSESENGAFVECPRTERLPVRQQVDICVLGGSCTGVFAAVRAARLGARVALVERQNLFGGVAVSALVNVWHSLLDTEFQKTIIGGLTSEVINRLTKRDAVRFRQKNESIGCIFNSSELAIELDELVLESGITPYLHTLFSEPYFENGKLSGVIIDGKSGRGVIKANYFIDATGDGDLCTRLGWTAYRHEEVQPPTACAHLSGFDSGKMNRLLEKYADEFKISKGFSWGETIPPTKDYMFSGTRVYNVDCADSSDLTRAEMESRRQIRALMDMYRKYGQPSGPDSEHPFGLLALPSSIGIRETRHIKCRHRITDIEAMNGKRYEDAIANGSYRFDIHHQDKSGVTFSYLDGSTRYIDGDHKVTKGRWRPETTSNPTYYQFPLRALIPEKSKNVLIAGRMLDADRNAFSGMRVMVNMNQLGEAAGTAAWLALQQNSSVEQVNPQEVRKLLSQGGSIIL